MWSNWILENESVHLFGAIMMLDFSCKGFIFFLMLLKKIITKKPNFVSSSSCKDSERFFKDKCCHLFWPQNMTQICLYLSDCGPFSNVVLYVRALL